MLKLFTRRGNFACYTQRMWDASGAAGPHHITRYLADLGRGNKAALDALTPLVYSELHKLAKRHLSDERNAATIQPTVLIHEAYLRFVGQDLPEFQSRAHFFGVASQLMRQILVDHARRQRSQKRGSGAARVELGDGMGGSNERATDVVALDDSLSALAALDERKAKIIELRFFGGMTAEETAVAMGISLSTVRREQRMAEAWLLKEMKQA